MTLRPASLCFLVALLSLLIASCGRGRMPTEEGGDNKATDKPPAAEHTHERGKMLLADAGNHHALLTAHLSPKGNELDIFFETDEEKPTPVALAVASFTAFARDGMEVHEVRFTCAPASERPQGEKEGTCSHFVAQVPWMKRDATIELTIPSLKIGTGTHRVVWKGFRPSRYAHHDEK